MKTIKVTEKEMKVIESSIVNYFQEKINFSVLSVSETDNAKIKELLYNICISYTDIVLLMHEFNVIDFNDTLLKKFKFKHRWIRENKDKINKNSIKYLIEFFNTEKTLEKQKVQEFFRNFNNILDKEYNLYSILESLNINVIDKNNILLTFFYNIDEKVLTDLLNKIKNNKYFLVLLDRKLTSSTNEYEDKYFKIANKSSCLREGGCYEYRNNTGVDFYPCIVVNNSGKIEGRIIYCPQFDIFINGYRNNKGSYKWLPLLEQYYCTDNLYTENLRRGYNMYPQYRFYIDFITSDSVTKVDEFLNNFHSLQCANCEIELTEDEAVYSEDSEEYYCEDCFYNLHRYCDYCGEYRHIYYHDMIFLPYRDLYTCDYETVN